MSMSRFALFYIIDRKERKKERKTKNKKNYLTVNFIFISTRYHMFSLLPRRSQNRLHQPSYFTFEFRMVHKRVDKWNMYVFGHKCDVSFLGQAFLSPFSHFTIFLLQFSIRLTNVSVRYFVISLVILPYFLNAIFNCCRFE